MKQQFEAQHEKTLSHDTDALMEGLLTPLRQITPSPQLRMANRRRMHEAALAAQRGQHGGVRGAWSRIWTRVRLAGRLFDWSRARLALPVPVALLGVLAMGALASWSLIHGLNSINPGRVRPGASPAESIPGGAIPPWGSGLNPLAETGAYIGGIRFVTDTPAPAAAPAAIPPGLERWVFDQSPVILNDRQYLGKLTAAGGPLAYIDVPGLARVEWALVPFDGASESGRLADGRLTLTGADPNVLEIFLVRNGSPRNGGGQQILTGQTYPVWVHWGSPTLANAAADAADIHPGSVPAIQGGVAPLPKK